MNLALQVAKSVLPQPVGHYLRQRHRAFIFSRAMPRFIRDPQAALAADSPLLSDLIYGWGNECWSAREEYLAACVSHALQCRGPILECGSGLTTLILGAIAQCTGNSMLSLEHNPLWRDIVTPQLGRYGIHAAQVCHAPLRSYGDFSWYDVSSNKLLPDAISLVICDGPPADTPGGRYGLLPIMRSRLAPHAVVLLDDASREQERVIADRWAEELGCRYEVLGVEKPYAHIDF